MRHRITPPPFISLSRHATRRAGIGILAAFLLVAAMAVPASAAGRVFYMSPGGNDASTGSRSHPWRSIYVSMRKLRAGDTLYVRGGSYSFRGTHYSSLAGTATNRILIRNYPGETPVFTGRSTPANFLYFDGNAAYVTLHGLTIRGGGSTAGGSSLIGFTDNARFIRLENMRLIGARTWTQNQHLVYVASDSVNDIVIKWSTFDGAGCVCAGLLQFYHDPNAARISVYANKFRNTDQAIMIWAGVSGLKIWRNHFTSVRIAVRHHNSGGTVVTDNAGTRVRIGVYADSKRNLSVSGNSW